MRWTIVCVLMVGCWTNKGPSNTSGSSTLSEGSGATAGGTGSSVSTTNANATNANATSADPASGFGSDSIVPGPLPPGCKRMRKTYRCSGARAAPGQSNSSPATVCDNCLANSDCTDKPGGQCVETGNQACSGPAHLVCKYPEARCGNQICPEPAGVMPP